MTWQSMDTAPRDGTAFLALRNGYKKYITISRWDEDKYAVKPRPFFEDCGSHRVSEARAQPPLLWMPLPEIPTEP